MGWAAAGRKHGGVKHLRIAEVVFALSLFILKRRWNGGDVPVVMSHLKVAGLVEGGSHISSRSGDGRLSPDTLPLEPKPTPLAADM